MIRFSITPVFFWESFRDVYYCSQQHSFEAVYCNLDAMDSVYILLVNVGSLNAKPQLVAHCKFQISFLTSGEIFDMVKHRVCF